MSVCSFRCISDPVSALCGGWRHPFVLPGGGTWTVHVQRRNQCMEDMSHIPRLVREFGIKSCDYYDPHPSKRNST